MKLRRLLAATAAAAVATSAMAVAVSAVEYMAPGDANNSGLIACLKSDNGTATVLENTDLAHTVTAFDIIVTADDFEQATEDIADGIWVGGDVCLCSPSWGWGQKGFDLAGGTVCITTVDEENECFVISYDNGGVIFPESDTYCQIHLHDYSNTVSVYGWAVEDVVLYNADGVDVRTLDGAATDEPVEDTPVEDEPVVDEPIEDEPVVDEPIEDEPVVDEPVVDEPVVDEPAVDTDAPATETGKDSPDTGVEGIAAVAGVVALAGVAVVASRKRK